MYHGVIARGAAPPQLTCPFQPSPRQGLTFFPEGGNRVVGEWETAPPKAERTVLLDVVLALKVPCS